MIKKNYKISFCVVSMNRLYQLKETLPQNIKDNEAYDELEFIILDYNSQDGTEEWVKHNFQQYLDSGKITYFKTIEPDHWNPSHSKNLAFKLSKGDIICNIWADYFTGYGFAEYVNDMFTKDNNIVLTPIDFHRTKQNYNLPGDVLGKVCVKRTDFLKINGFDEKMNKHGFEDYDFVNRLEMIDVKRVLIEEHIYLRYIPHEDDKRYSLPLDNLQGLYLNYITPSSTEVLLLYKDHRFQKGVLIDNIANPSDDYHYAYQINRSYFEYSLKDFKWETGEWKLSGKGISLLYERNIDENYYEKEPESKNFIRNKDFTCFYHIKNKELIENILVFEHYYYTRSIMDRNLANKTITANSDDYGSGIVFKNFRMSEPIIV